MGLNRYAARRDHAEKAIVEALRAVGADVTRISGEGAPDILVRFRGIFVGGYEIKTGKGKRTKAQQSSQWPILRDPAEALAEIGIYYADRKLAATSGKGRR